MPKSYNDTTGSEKHIIREYRSWCKSNCDLAYKLTQVQFWMKRATQENIQHLL